MPAFTFTLQLASAIGTRTLMVLACLILLAGCQSLTKREPLPADTQRQLLPFLKHWDVSGKIALRYGRENARASFEWKQRDQKYYIVLSGPFGIGLTTLKNNGENVRLESAKTGVQKAQSPEALMTMLFGWQVPVSNLQYWMLGIPAPDLAVNNEQLDETGWLTELSQEGWVIQYSKPIAHNGWTLPGKIVAKRDNIKIIAVNKEWKTHRAPRI